MNDNALDDVHWMRQAIELSVLCPPSATAYSVGAVIVADGIAIARGFSRQTGERDHAEEVALDGARNVGGSPLSRATLYSTLEPCSERASKPKACAQLIIESGISRVVIVWREPGLFVADCVGVELLRENGVVVDELHQLAEEAKAVNKHLGL